MYARFKSSKGSLKLGISTISNARSKVAVQNGSSRAQNGKNSDSEMSIKSGDVNNNGLKSPVINDVSVIENQFCLLMSDEDKFSDNIDENCIKYVQTKWKQYASEVGTPNGPTRYVDNSKTHEHLKDFSAFDMERWYIDHMHAWLLQSQK